MFLRSAPPWCLCMWWLLTVSPVMPSQSTRDWPVGGEGCVCVYVCVCVCVECHYSLSRCHAYNPSSSGCGRQPLLSSSSSTLSPSPPSSAKRPGSANPTHQTSSLPREEVLLVWAELERARDTLAEVQALRLETQEATGGGAHSDHDSSEEYLTSVQWLKVWRHLSEHSLFRGFALSLTTSFLPPPSLLSLPPPSPRSLPPPSPRSLPSPFLLSLPPLYLLVSSQTHGVRARKLMFKDLVSSLAFRHCNGTIPAHHMRTKGSVEMVRRGT